MYQNLLRSIGVLCCFIIPIMGALAQKVNLKGNVISNSGEALIGVTIVEENTSNGSATDFDGNYEVTVSGPEAKLTFSYTGFISQTITVGTQTQLDIILKEGAALLNEVVVIGYGSVKKSDLTGSVSSVKGQQIANTGTTSLDQALAGKSPGVIVTQNSGVPGGAASIRIRGISSLRGTEPLYVIDGIPFENTSLGSINGSDEGGADMSPLSTINPKDIASIEILKDASATAVYGSRGANGVIIVTTKSGKAGENVVEASMEFGITTLPRKVAVLDANEYVITQYEALRNAGGTADSNARLDSARAGVLKTSDWQDFLFQQGQSQNYGLNFSGGTKKLRYAISNSYLKANGIIQDSDFERYATRIKLNAAVNDKLKVGASISYSKVSSDARSTSNNYNASTGTNSIVRRALRANPLIQFEADFEDSDNFITPRQAINANDYNNYISQFSGALSGDLQLSKRFKFSSSVSFSDRGADQEFYQKDIFPETTGVGRGGESKVKSSTTNRFTNTNKLNYNYRGGKHKLSALLGQATEITESDGITISNAGYSNDLLTTFAPQSASFFDPDTRNYSQDKLLSFFTRMNYSFNDKWLVTFTGRYDGSSKFAKNNKFAFFPAGAVAYRLSEEDYIRNIAAISSLKLRLSYGVSGNQSIRPYQSLNQFQADQHAFGDGAGGESLTAVFYTSQLPNENLLWEETAQLNAGMDLGLFNSRLNVTLDYFRKVTSQLLVVGNKIPAHSGFTTLTENLGSMETNGLELGLNAYVIDRGPFSWNIGGSISTGKTVITDLGANFVESGFNQGWVPGGTQRLIIGEEIGAFYGYKTIGIAQYEQFEEFQNLSEEERIDLWYANPNGGFTSTGGVVADRPGQQLYEDVNKDGLINELDRQVLGRAQADITVGLNTTVTYGNLELNIVLDGQFGQEVANVINFSLLQFNRRQQLQLVRQAWAPDNQSNIYPALDSRENGATTFFFSDRYIEDGSFIRLQNVTLSYNLPSTWTNKMGLSRLKVFASGFNLLMLTDYTGFNPDVSVSGGRTQSLGHDNGGYPAARSFRVGVTLRPR